jgi:hypothetical protein
MISGHRSSLNYCALIGIATAGCIADGIADQDDMAAEPPSTAPEVSKVSQASETAAMKPMPVKPQDTHGVTTDETLPADLATEAAAAPAAGAGLAWTVNLVASPSSLWTGVNTLLTATTNVDVQPHGYFIKIWDDDRGEEIASCNAGTTCWIAVAKTGPHTTTFKAMVTASNGISVASAFASVYWHVSGVRLTESETTVAAGSSVVLTSFTDYDINTSPYFVHIQDDTTRTILRSCAVGTKCSVTVSQTAATTHRYRACFAGGSTTYPPPSILECTPQKLVTWTGNPAIRVFLQPSAPNTITATSSINVTGTPFFIQIYNRHGIRVAVCNAGTTCSITGAFSCDENLTAAVGVWSPTIPGIELFASPVSRMFPLIRWTVPLSGVVAGPCPSPQPPR